ncbi:MAG: radical SAM protein [Spirochaetaceae bacterium]|jgi:MoaA/NifB/PqqE/SkfB family radical SAM enzyme|nr:radical SAM protein [Spirochaetaceae bacterium]
MTLRNPLDLMAVFFGGAPGQVVIQVTNYCNASCPQCGMRKTAGIKRHQLDKVRIRKILDQCARKGIAAVSLTGGEPFIKPLELLELLNYGSRRGIRYLRSGTNGYMFSPEGKAAGIEETGRFVKALSATGIRNFWISLDSADTQTHETMRGLPGVVEGIRRALPLFHAQGLYPAANLGINRNVAGSPIPPLREPPDESRFFEAFTAGFTAFFSKAVELGFTMANVCYPMSSVQAGLVDEQPVYGAISGDPAVDFSPPELRLVFKALLEVIPRFRSRIRIFTPLSVLYALSHEDDSFLFPCLGGCAYFFIDCKDGRLYPCGYRGSEDLGEDLEKAITHGRMRKPFCMKCHWECFRDPSQLFGLARYIIRHPVLCFIKKRLDPRMLKLWFTDMGYYIRNDFFNGRKPG